MWGISLGIRIADQEREEKREEKKQKQERRALLPNPYSTVSVAHSTIERICELADRPRISHGSI
jgi:hypothetical protein